MSIDDERIRAIEKENTRMAVKIEALEAQEKAQWSELRGIRKEQREEYEKLLRLIGEKTDSLATMITSNKIASAMMGTGMRVTATVLMALFTIAGTITGIAVAIKRLLLDG